MRIFLLLLITVIALQAIEKNDFAYERDIKTSSQQGLVKIKIPLELYKHLNTRSMLDIVVFDTKNNIMPHSIEKLDLSQQSVQTESLPFSRVKRIKQSKETIFGISYQGKKLTFNESNKVSDEDYIVDTSKMEDGIDYLQIKSPDSEYMIQTDLACSEDLSYWQEIARTQMLANITMQNSNIIKNTLKLNGRTCKYLKIHTQKPLNVKSIIATKVKTFTQKPSSQPLKFNKVNNGIEFKLSKQITIKGLQFVLPHKEQLYKLNLFRKNDGDTEWSFLKQITIYTLQNGAISSLESSFRANADNYRIEPAKNSYLPEELKLSFIYDTAELYFIAQGTPPYSLAYGSTKSSVSSTNLNNMVKLNKNFISATLGDEKILNINANKIEKKTNYTTVLVWVSLALGIIILSYMSYKLIGELRIKK